ncbi:hypothetical protein [Streptomyces mirabilis]|uniref:hypothetical protein n=1 Tax=Streptomyces mirabilis TaxID=68239 RepID=UPI00367AC8F7
MAPETDRRLPRTFTSASGDVHWDRLGRPGRPPVALLHGLGQPLVVAHDFGGAVVLRAHLLHGARYRALALVDPVAPAPWGSPFFRLVGEHADVFERLPPALHGAWTVPATRPTTGRSPRPSNAALAGAGHLVQEGARVRIRRGRGRNPAPRHAVLLSGRPPYRRVHELHAAGVGLLVRARALEAGEEGVADVDGVALDAVRLCQALEVPVVGDGRRDLDVLDTMISVRGEVDASLRVRAMRQASATGPNR